MNFKRNFVLIALIICVQAPAQAQVSTLNMKYSLERESGVDNLILIGETDFPTASVNVSAVAIGKPDVNGVQARTTLGIPAPAPNNKVVGTTIVGATYTAKIDMRGVPANVETLSIDATAQEGPTGRNASSHMTVDVKTIRAYFNDLDIIARLNGCVVDPPNISASIGTILDRAVYLRVSSDRAVRVKATAYAHGAPHAASSPSISESDEVEIPSNGAAPPIKIARLTENRDFDFVVREVSQHPGRAAVEVPIVQTALGAPVHTLAALRTPGVSFRTGTGTGIKIVRNQQLVIPVVAVDAPRAKVTLLKTNSLNQAMPIEAAVVTLDTPTTPGAPQPGTITFDLKQSSLDKNSKYQIQLQGLTQFDEADPGTISLSDPFPGLDSILSKAVEVEFTGQGIKFKAATTDNAKALLEVRINTPTTEAQPLTFAKSASGVNPEYILSFDEIKTALGAQTGSSANLPLVIGVKADDGSERSQNIAITLRVNTTEVKPAAKARVTDFVSELRTDPNLATDKGKSIKTGDIIKTGLSMLLRFLVPIP